VFLKSSDSIVEEMASQLVQPFFADTDRPTDTLCYSTIVCLCLVAGYNIVLKDGSNH